MPTTFGEVIALADVMSRSQHAIPEHLRGNAGACLAVTMQSMRWEMDPFAVAAKTYKVKDIVAYEAQVISAVINTRAGLIRRPSIDFKGEGAKRQCVVTGEFLDGSIGVYESPEIGSITTKNSPLWKSDPDQQLGYFSVRSFGRRHCPEVILGVYDRDEVETAEPLRDVTPRNAGTGLLNKLQSTTENVDLPPEGFGIRDITEEVGPMSEPPETTPKKRRAAKPKDTALDAIAEAEPEIVQQVVEDHGTRTVEGLLEEASEGIAALEESLEAGKSKADERLEAIERRAAIDAPAPADTVYYLADDEVYPSGRRAVYFNGLPNGVVEATDPHPVHTQHAPEKGKGVVQTDTPTADDIGTTEAVDTSAGNPVDPDLTQPVGPFDLFDIAAREAKDWPELSQALTALSRSPEWKTDAEAKRNARVKAWAVVSRWNEDGAKLDPATSPNLLQIAVTAWDDPEMIQGLYATAQTMPWLAEAEEQMQNSVSRFIIDRLAEIRGA